MEPLPRNDPSPTKGWIHPFIQRRATGEEEEEEERHPWAQQICRVSVNRSWHSCSWNFTHSSSSSSLPPPPLSSLERCWDRQAVTWSQHLSAECVLGWGGGAAHAVSQPASKTHAVHLQPVPAAGKRQKEQQHTRRRRMVEQAGREGEKNRFPIVTDDL